MMLAPYRRAAAWTVALLLAGCTKDARRPADASLRPAPEASAAVDAGPAAVDAGALPGPDSLPPPPSGRAAIPLPAAGPGATSGFEGYYSWRAPGYRAVATPLPLPLAEAELRAGAGETLPALAALGAGDEALQRVARDGFVVVGASERFDFDEYAEAFQALRGGGIPPYVSADAALHLYHLVFDGLLAELETRELIPLLGRLLAALRDQSVAALDRPEPIAAAARANLAFLDTARVLLDPAVTPHAAVADLVRRDRVAVEAHASVMSSAVFGYDEDFTQYVPRGHYARTEALARYFRAMMWLGRLGLLVRAAEDPAPAGRVPLADARRFAVQTALLVRGLYDARVDGRPALDAWIRLYRPTAFFAGFADDLTPLEAAAACERTAGESWTVEAVADPAKVDRLRFHLIAPRVPELYEGTDGKQVDGVLARALELPPERAALAATGGLRLLGQRYAPDAGILAALVHPRIGPHRGGAEPFTRVAGPDGGVRGFARGLDLMAVLGSERAAHALEAAGDADYVGYAAAVEAARAALPPAGDRRWHATAYWAWLEALRELLLPTAPPVQAFQTTDAWRDRLLAGALASWTVLRHDTLLYVKQGVVPKGLALPPAAPPAGFVDPVPELYARLGAMGRMMRAALGDLGLLPPAGEGAALLERFEGLLFRLQEAAIAELEDRPFTEEQRRFVADFAGEAAALHAGLARLLAAAGAAEALDLRTTLVADVLTNGETAEALEEASGPLELLVAAVREPGGTRLFPAAGPVSSQREFRVPVAERLTDEAWRARLANGTAPAAEPWTCTFRVPCPAVP